MARMNFLQRIMQRLRPKFPTMDFLKNKHEDCLNFENGRCNFYHITLNPKGNACPHFKPKKKEAGTKTSYVEKEN
jgi:hypothetical protein